ncbi:MAG: DUF4190 domain-containing protein [Phycisphaerales bacterium]|nr:MAG: DUF4190 domain-containing protein [Phycisphaerales bacterium]
MRCGNCGAVVPPPESITPRASPAGVSVSTALPTTSSADGLAVAALILGMLFFVPVVTQVLAITLGIIALLRRPGDRPGRGGSRTAWAGLLLGCVFLAGWSWLLILVVSTVTRGFAARPGGVVGVGYGRAYRPVDAASEAAMEESIAARACLEALFSAARAYHLDYRAWPENVDVLTPIYLSEEMGDTARRQSGAAQELMITMVAGVDPARDPPDRIIAYSAQVRHDLVGEGLARPHRWVLRLNGRVTLVPADDVNNSPGGPNAASSESSGSPPGQPRSAP